MSVTCYNAINVDSESVRPALSEQVQQGELSSPKYPQKTNEYTPGRCGDLQSL